MITVDDWELRQMMPSGRAAILRPACVCRGYWSRAKFAGPGDRCQTRRQCVPRDRAAGRWAERYLPADSVSEVSARVLAREFSEDELRELLSFYTSPIGKRFVDAQARLRTATNSETSRILLPHRQELQDTLRRVATHRP